MGFVKIPVIELQDDSAPRCSFVKKMKSDKTALETVRTILYSIDAVTSIFEKSDKTAIC